MFDRGMQSSHCP
jgi:hypothetical protein